MHSIHFQPFFSSHFKNSLSAGHSAILVHIVCRAELRVFGLQCQAMNEVACYKVISNKVYCMPRCMSIGSNCHNFAR